MTRTAIRPDLARQAATFVDKLDGLLDQFGVHIDEPIKFGLIESYIDEPAMQFEAIPLPHDDPAVPTDLAIGFVEVSA